MAWVVSQTLAKHYKSIYWFAQNPLSCSSFTAAWSVSELANNFSQAPYLASSWFGEPASEVYPIDQLNEGDGPNITMACLAVGTCDKVQNLKSVKFWAPLSQEKQLQMYRVSHISTPACS